MKGLSGAWADRLKALGRAAESELLICAPYMTGEGVDLLIRSFGAGFRSSGRLMLVTDLSPLNICQSSIDPGALVRFFDAVGSVTLWHLPRVHAKVYIADAHAAIVTSANLTAGGLFRNYEYGIETNRPEEVRAIRTDLAAYAGLGAVVRRAQLDSYADVGRELAAAYRRQLEGARTAHRRAFAEQLREADERLIALRVGGGAMTMAFERTIEYVLQREGPLTTRQLHPLIQAIHPDLCDDGVDRVIDGVHYGKRWKHVVRSAQSHLKERGVIGRSGDLWSLLSPREQFV